MRSGRNVQIRRFVADGLDWDGGPALVLLHMVQTVIHFDALQPMAKRGASLKAAQAKIRFNKYLLGEVLGYAFVHRHISAIGHNAVAIVLD